MAAIGLRGVRHVAEDGTVALDSIDLDVEDGELLGVLGPSGSGKSALLRAIAGIDQPTRGVIEIDGRKAVGRGVRDRNIVIANDPATLTNVMAVIEEVVLPPELRRAEAHGRGSFGGGDRRRARPGRGDRRRRLRGTTPGRRTTDHRAAGVPREILKSALGRRPAALLLDDPFRGLDGGARAAMITRLRSFQRSTGIATILVTNSQRHTLAAADRIAVLRDGAVEQIAQTREVLNRPANRFVASFLGEPPRRLVGAEVEQVAGLGWLRLAGQRLRYPGGLPGPLAAQIGQPLELAADPGMVRLATSADDQSQCIDASVRAVLRRGWADLVTVEVGTGRWDATASGAGEIRIGDRVTINVDVGRLLVFDAATGQPVWHGRG